MRRACVLDQRVEGIGIEGKHAVFVQAVGGDLEREVNVGHALVQARGAQNIDV